MLAKDSMRNFCGFRCRAGGWSCHFFGVSRQMPPIAAQRMEALLKGMELIDQVEEPAQLPQLFADGCARAIPCANVSFNLIDRRLEGLHVARSRGVQVPTEEDSPLLRNLKEHPMIMRILCEDSLEIMAFSDFYSRRQFHRTCLYNEYYRRSDTQQQICFQVGGRNADDYAIVAVNHVSGSAFSEADRQLAAILQRHLASVLPPGGAHGPLSGRGLWYGSGGASVRFGSAPA